LATRALYLTTALAGGLVVGIIHLRVALV
jgi:hypothetical protein